MQQPSVGRVVHYYPAAHVPPCAAIVTGLDPHEPTTAGRVDLFVMPPGMQPYPLTDVDFSDEPGHCRWTWPPRAPIGPPPGPPNPPRPPHDHPVG